MICWVPKFPFPLFLYQETLSVDPEMAASTSNFPSPSISAAYTLLKSSPAVLIFLGVLLKLPDPVFSCQATCPSPETLLSPCAVYRMSKSPSLSISAACTLRALVALALIICSAPNVPFPRFLYQATSCSAKEAESKSKFPSPSKSVL